MKKCMLVLGGALSLLAQAEFQKPGAPENVPELLVTAAGEKVTTRAQWEQMRKPELLKIFREREYGVRPVERPGDLAFTETAAPETVYGGKAIRKRVRATYSGPGGKESFNFSVWIPKAERPVPVFIHSSPRPSETADDVNGPRPVYWLPAEEIVSRGYAVVAYCNQEVAIDVQGPDAVTNGVFKAYGPANLRQRRSDEWGILSAWAWGMSRIADWIETEPLLDAKRMATVGLSRNGKTSLVAGAFDERFALVISCCSGCSGAKLNHMHCSESETIRIMVEGALWKWFCPNYAAYAGHDRDAKMPFDQHELLALVAPRLLYVSSASEDAWAGPRGEFASARLASPVWALYGRTGLVGDTFPKPEQPLQEGCVGYHLRSGVHDITRYDWQRYMDFADRHGWNVRN